MTRFYFDFEHSGVMTLDRVGKDFSDVNAARREAISVLAAAIRHDVAQHSDARLAVRVRDDKGAVLEVSATFQSKTFKR